MNPSTPAAPQKHRELIFAVIALVASTLGVALLGECAIRIITSKKLIYNIEMVRYAKTLKMADPSGQVSHVHRANQSAKLMGVDIRLNSLGHRGHELTSTRSSSQRRVFVLGSSVTMGWGVPEEHVFTSLVENRLNSEKPFGPKYSFEFANAGIGNYNTYAQLKLFQRQYPVVKPDLVVLHYFISDAEPRGMGRNSFILKNSLFAAYLYDKFSLLRISRGQRVDLFQYYDRIYSDPKGGWQDTIRQIAEIQETLKRDSIPFVIMIVPDFHFLDKGTPFAALYSKIEAQFQSMKIDTINTFEDFRERFSGKEAELWIQADDPHPNGQGHKLMADVLYRHLEQSHYFKTENK